MQRLEALSRQQCVASTSQSCPPLPSRGRSRSSRGAVVAAVGPAQDFNLWRGAELPREYKAASVVPGELTLATPRLSAQRAFQRMLESPHRRAAEHYGAFYSSVLGGITVEPGLMAIHADDHLVHAGHGVGVTVPLVGGALYRLDAYMARLAASSEAVGVGVPMSAAALRRVVLDTAAASRRLNGHVKVWLTAGRGSFGASARDTTATGAYALVTTEWASLRDVADRTKGWAATASPVEPPAPYFAALCASGGLPAAVAQAEAEGRGFDAPLFVDEATGAVTPAPGMSLAIITHDHTFAYLGGEPISGSAASAAGVTITTLAELIPEAYDADDLPITKVERRAAITLNELTGALEAMLVSSAYGVVGVPSVDGSPIADGQPGVFTLALQAVLDNDREPRAGSPRHTPVPYGGLTGMAAQLR